MQFILELFTLFLLFLLFRQTVIKAFPVEAINMQLSNDSLAALKRYRRRYIFLLWTTGLIFTLFFFLIFYYLFILIHRSGGFEEVLIVERTALLLPSFILGFLMSTFVARWLNNKLQKDGLSFFFDGYTDEWQGFNRNSLRRWHVIIVLLLSLVLLVTQSGIYLKRKGNLVYVKQSGKNERVFSRANIVKIEETGRGKYSIITDSADTIYTGNFSGNTKNFIEGLK